jgi:hypothetical protein
MVISGVRAITTTSFTAAIEDPENFKMSRSVGACPSLTTRRYQSGEVDYDGHISRRGDAHLRGLFYEAATVIVTRTHAESDLRRWGVQLRERIGFKRAAVAVAHKLAVIMHAMLKSGEEFNRQSAPPPDPENSDAPALRRAEASLPVRGLTIPPRLLHLRAHRPAACVPHSGRFLPRCPFVRRHCLDREDDAAPGRPQA